MAYYRADGVRITHDPYARGMAEKYGAPGKTDADGFDPYADSVDPGIYGGTVKRDDMGQVVIGRQYQNHNPRPGPVYSGGGYTPTSKRLSDAAALEAWLNEHPDLVNEITTGGAQPLHNCGMSARNQGQVALLVSKGADIEAVDTYGYTPLHRMASNNLAAGAKALLEAGADPNFRGGAGECRGRRVASSRRARHQARGRERPAHRRRGRRQRFGPGRIRRDAGVEGPRRFRGRLRRPGLGHGRHVGAPQRGQGLVRGPERRLHLPQPARWHVVD